MATIRISKQRTLVLTGIVLILITFWILSDRNVARPTPVTSLHPILSPHEPGRAPQGRTPRKYVLQTDGEETTDGNTTADTFARRRQRVHTVCQHLRADYDAWLQGRQPFCEESSVKEHLIHAGNISATVCVIEKNGASFWTRVLHVLSGAAGVTNPLLITERVPLPRSLSTLSGLTFDKSYEILRSSTKAVMVRHPFSRLLAVYLDGIYIPDEQHWTLFGDRISQRTGAGCRHVTFDQFVRTLLTLLHTERCLDPHFAQSFRICHPCEIDYDLIGKFEHFESDALFIIKNLRKNAKISFPNFKTDADVQAITNMVTSVFENTWWTEYMTSREVLLRVWRRLQSRGILGIYDHFPEVVSNQITRQEFQRLAIRAYTSGDKVGRDRNRYEVLKEAFAQLSDDTIGHLQDIFKVELELFGYNKYPPYLRFRQHKQQTYFQFIELS